MKLLQFMVIFIVFFGLAFKAQRIRRPRRFLSLRISQRALPFGTDYKNWR